MASKRLLPEVSDGLIKHLSERFPNQLPPIDKASEKELWLRLGEQRVVEHLKSLNKHQDAKKSVHPVTQS